MNDEYTVSITFETTVTAPSPEVAKQAARKKAQSMNEDAANSHVELSDIDVDQTEN